MELSIIQLTATTLAISSVILAIAIYTIIRLNTLQKNNEEQSNIKFTELAEIHKSQSHQLQSVFSELLEKQNDQVNLLKQSYVDLKKINNEQFSKNESHFKDITRNSLESLNKLLTINAGNNETLTNKLTNSEKYLLNALSEIQIQLASNINKSQTEIIKSNNQVNENITTKLTSTNSETNSNITQSQNSLVKEINKHIFINKQSQITLTEQIASYVQSMKIENAIDLTNKLTESRDLKVETEGFIKYLGDCKVTKIVDKAANQQTEIIYKNGLKVASETYANNKLKYVMSYDRNGKLTNGKEYCDQGKLVFEYQYNEAGEVSNRIDHKT